MSSNLKQTPYNFKQSGGTIRKKCEEKDKNY